MKPKMQAVTRSSYGSADCLTLAEVDQPVLTDSGVLVRVHAASVNAGDWHLMRGEPFLIRPIYGGLFKPKIKILGFDMAGRVAAVGKDVKQFQPGDEVFGDLTESGFGAFAEYVCAPETALALKPTSLSFEAAAAVPGAGLTALQALQLGQVQSGQRVLINGASGGVGSFAVQLAKAFGAEVTALCSSQKIDMVRSLGADQVMDYSEVDVTQTGQRYDLILDAAAYRSVLDYRPVLAPKGIYVLVGGSTARLFQVLLLGAGISWFMGRRVKCLVSKPNQADLLTLKQLLEAGKIVPCIDQSYDLSQVPAAIRHLEQRHVRGKVVIRVQ